GPVATGAHRESPVGPRPSDRWSRRVAWPSPRIRSEGVGKIYERIDGRLRDFLERQPVFFVATAPLSPTGRVNVSPKGIGGTFAILDERTVAYLDITASGAETIAHLRENGRITLMFCAFSGPPNVVRLHGQGRVISLYDAEFSSYLQHFTEYRGARAVIVVDVERISDSCGYGVPLMDY